MTFMGTTISRFWIADGILYFEYKANPTIVEVAQHCCGSDFKMSVLCFVWCPCGIVGTESAGRDYLAQSGSILTRAVGLLITHEKYWPLVLFD
jgi:hypothetical protein